MGTEESAELTGWHAGSERARETRDREIQQEGAGKGKTVAPAEGGFDRQICNT